MLQLIAPKLQGSAHALQHAFRNAEPFPHLVIDNFLAPDFAATLLKEFPAFDEERARNELGEVGRKAVHDTTPSTSAVARTRTCTARSSTRTSTSGSSCTAIRGTRSATSSRRCCRCSTAA